MKPLHTTRNLRFGFPPLGLTRFGDKINLPSAKNDNIRCVKGLSPLYCADYEYCTTEHGGQDHLLISVPISIGFDRS